MPKRKSKSRAARNKAKNLDLELAVKKDDSSKKINNKNPIYVIDTQGDLNKKMKYRAKLLNSHKILGLNDLAKVQNSGKYLESQINRECRKLDKIARDNIPQVDIRKANKRNNNKGSFDLWGDDENTQNTKKTKKPNQIKAVSAPTTNVSYNPSFESHQQSMGEVIAKTLAKEKIEQKIINTVRIKAEYKDLKDPNRDERVTQIKQELDNPELTEEDSESEQEAQNDPIKKSTKRKTEKKRNQKKRRKLKRISRIREKLKNKVSTPVEKLLPLKENIEKNLEHQKTILKLRRLKKDESKKTETGKVGPNKFDEQIDYESVLTTEQLTGSIRTVPKSKNLIFNTFLNIQKRGLVEPRSRTEKKRARTARVTIYSKKKEWHDLEKELTKDL